jgi:hypothetical protein
MIDPFTAVGLATSAFNILKQGISAGKDIQEMSGTLAKWGAAFSDFQYAEDKTKNPPFYKMMSDNSANAIEIFAQKKKMESMRKEIKDHISFVYGPPRKKRWRPCAKKLRITSLGLMALPLGMRSWRLKVRCGASARKRRTKNKR